MKPCVSCFRGLVSLLAKLPQCCPSTSLLCGSIQNHSECIQNLNSFSTWTDLVVLLPSLSKLIHLTFSSALVSPYFPPPFIPSPKNLWCLSSRCLCWATSHSSISIPLTRSFPSFSLAPFLWLPLFGAFETFKLLAARQALNIKQLNSLPVNYFVRGAEKRQ